MAEAAARQAVEWALGAADGGAAEEEAEVGGEAEAAGMGGALAIEEDDVGAAAQFSEGGFEGGAFAEGEQAGDVGEGGFGFGGGDFEDFEVGETTDDDGGGEAGDGRGAGAGRAARFVGDVGAGDGAEGGEVEWAVVAEQGAEALLDGDGVVVSQEPGMEVAEFHFCLWVLAEKRKKANRRISNNQGPIRKCGVRSWHI